MHLNPNHSAKSRCNFHKLPEKDLQNATTNFSTATLAEKGNPSTGFHVNNHKDGINIPRI